MSGSAVRPAFLRRVNIALSALGVMSALVVVLVAHAMRPRAVPALSDFGAVPGFRLVDERGAPYGAAAMLGHASVADFVFTRCTGSCPLLTAHMAELQRRFERDHSGVRLVSFSVDPDHDTPAVLSDYAAKAGADLARWTFVTGPANDVIRAVVQGFKVSAAKIARDAGDYDVTHGDWFVLVDPGGRLRGYYATDDAADLDRLAADAERLERR